MDKFQEILIRYIYKLRKEHTALVTREAADIADAQRNHGSIAESAWKPRVRAERRIKAAVGLLEALSE